MVADQKSLSADEQQLADLGYKQELSRSWSGFSNFAISFSIISILAGCFTTFYFGWNNGGPIAISLGWPIIAAFILVIGFCMSELVSAYPTSGGIYWWASKLGGVKAGYYTGWLNLIGLVAIVASVAYGAATFFDYAFSRFSESWAAGYSLERVFVMFLVILIFTALVNIFSSHLLAIFNNISVWWHVFGASIVVLILVFFLKDGATHWNVTDVFTGRVNNTFGLFGSRRRPERCRHERPGLLVLRRAAGLPAHAVHDHRLRRLRPPLRGDPGRGQPRGQGHVAVDLLLGDRRLDPPAGLPVRGPGPGAVSAGGGGVQVIFDQALTPTMAGTRPADRQHRPAVLHHRLPDLRPRACCSRSAVTVPCPAPGTGPSSTRARPRSTRSSR